MKVIDKYERAAKQAAKKSTHRTFNLGAVLVAKGSIVATGCNLAGFGGLEMKYGNHAEARILDNPPTIAKKGAVLYVVRLTKSGKFAMSKPCKSCTRMIKMRNVSKVYYTDHDGIWQKMELT
jgi:deoxycytidylate deaminase